MSAPEDILAFWFSSEAEPRWFKSTDAFDAQIRQKFEPVSMELSAAIKRPDIPHAWELLGPEAHLALIITLDQFPRNMYRNTAAAFAWDDKARQVCHRLVETGADLRLTQRQRSFAYMPLMHSENLADQTRCVELCDSRLENEGTLQAAKTHRDIIKRFGHFPHRHAVLGRKITAEEQAFLDGGGFRG